MITQPLYERLEEIAHAVTTGQDLAPLRAKVDRSADLVTIYDPRGPVFLKLSNLASAAQGMRNRAKRPRVATVPVLSIVPPVPVAVRPARSAAGPPGEELASLLREIDQAKQAGPDKFGTFHVKLPFGAATFFDPDMAEELAKDLKRNFRRTPICCEPTRSTMLELLGIGWADYERKTTAARGKGLARAIGNFTTDADRERTQQALEHNLAEATKSGNAKLIQVMRDALDRAQKL